MKLRPNFLLYGVIGLIFFSFIMLLVVLPDACYDTGHDYYDHCHNARHYHVTCDPDTDCWNNWPHDHAPGSNGIILIFFLIIPVIFCVFVVGDDCDNTSINHVIHHNYEETHARIKRTHSAPIIEHIVPFPEADPNPNDRVMVYPIQ